MVAGSGNCRVGCQQIMGSRRGRHCLVLLLTCLASTLGKSTHRALHGERRPVAVSDGRQKSADGKTYFMIREPPSSSDQRTSRHITPLIDFSLMHCTDTLLLPQSLLGRG